MFHGRAADQHKSHLSENEVVSLLWQLETVLFSFVASNFRRHVDKIKVSSFLDWNKDFKQKKENTSKTPEGRSATFRVQGSGVFFVASISCNMSQTLLFLNRLGRCPLDVFVLSSIFVFCFLIVKFLFIFDFFVELLFLFFWFVFFFFFFFFFFCCASKKNRKNKKNKMKKKRNAKRFLAFGKVDRYRDDGRSRHDQSF